MTTTPEDLRIAAEAVCSALYRTEWEFLGESPGGVKTFFQRGEMWDHERVQVVIERKPHDNMVLVNAFWWSKGTRPHRRVHQYWAIGGGKPLEPQVEYVVTRLLELYRDVISHTGKALYGSAVAKS